MKSDMLLMIAGFFLILSIFLFLYVFYQQHKRRVRQQLSAKPKMSKKLFKNQLDILLLTAYKRMRGIILLNGFLLKIRRRLEVLNTFDEYSVRRETSKITLTVLGVSTFSVILLAVLSQRLLLVIVYLLILVIVNQILIETLIHRVENRLLKQLTHFLGDVRHYYHQHKMVEEAIYEAAQLAKYEAHIQGERIYDMLTSDNPDRSLEEYYDVAPNRFLKAFAGISYLIMENGDRQKHHGSLYLNAINLLIQEVNLEILRREKLSYLLSGLTAISLAPLFLLYPLKNWAVSNFPIVQDFYLSKTGLLLHVMFYASILFSYLFLRKLQEHNETRYIAKSKSEPMLEKKLYRLAPIRWVVDRLKPSYVERKHFEQRLLLKNTNSPLTLEWLYVRRVLLCLLFFCVSVGFFIYLHWHQVQTILYKPTSSMFVQSNEWNGAQEITDFDRQIIEDVKGVRPSKEEIIKHVSNLTGVGDYRLHAMADRIYNKIQTIDQAYLKWWELLLSFAIGYLGYQLPIVLMVFQKRLRQMDMQYEVDQYHTLIAILSQFERTSVENILEWMERFAIIFKQPLQKCLQNLDSGPEEALEQLKIDVPFIAFVRVVERLQMSVERIPIVEAFADLEVEREFYRRQREEYNERVLNEKAEWGKMIGFIPLYALIFLMLLFPMLYISLVELSHFRSIFMR